MPNPPPTMIAIGIEASAGSSDREPDVLKPGTRPLPSPQAGEILVKVAAAGVNRPDVMQRLGLYPPPPGAPDILGLEISGTVAALGEGARKFAIGDRVCALVPGGGYAAYAVVHESNALPVPGGLTMVEAAAVPETFFTVWTNVFDRGGLRPGETLLVHGGTSGIGTTATMLAKAFGSRVIVTAGGADKCAACKTFGADVAIDYKTQDFVAETKAATEGKGANVILDMVGGSYIERNYHAAAVGARIVQIAFMQGASATVNFTPVLMKRLVHTGSTLRPRSPAEKALIAGALETHVWPLLAAGRCKPIIDSTFPFESAAKAHARMESSAHIGKIVLTMPD